MRNFFTSESVTSGHPDKVCDNISDAILDAFLAGDKNSRVACECSVTTNFVLVMGEITSNATVDIKKVVKDVITRIGYTQSDIGFSADDVEILVKLNKQSPDIALGVPSVNHEFSVLMSISTSWAFSSLLFPNNAIFITAPLIINILLCTILVRL